MGVDSFTNLHNLALSYPDITFLATVPDLILVMISPEMKDQAKEIFKVDYDKSRQKQLLGYDTQFELGDFYCSSVTIRDVRFRTFPLTGQVFSTPFSIYRLCCQLL